MTLISVEVLETAKKEINSGLSTIPVSIDSGLEVTPEAIEWLKVNHFQIKVAESFGPTGITALIYSAHDGLEL